MVSAGDALERLMDRPRRVLIIVENLPVPFDRRVWTEARTLSAAGYTVSVICPRGPLSTRKYECVDGVHIFRHAQLPEGKGKFGYLAEYASALFWEFLYSLRVLRRVGFDCIHACNPPDLIFLIGWLYKRLLGKRFLFDHHDLGPELYEVKFGRRGILWRLLVGCERATFRLADVSIATNESYRSIATGRGGMRPEQVFTVRSGPELSSFQRRSPDPAWKNGRRHLVVYVGVIGSQEGLDLLLQAVEYIVRRLRRSDVQVVIIGSGPAWPGIKRACERLRLDQFVTLAGFVDEATKMTVLSTADVCVNPDVPSVLNDLSTMNKVMEYMAAGKAIVQFDLKEGRVSAGEASLYARSGDIGDFADKVLQLLDDTERRERMGALGRKRIENELAWAHEAPKLLRAYDALFSA
jgi:glycosyltransferase involved in cell wall biosynthesis